MVKPGDVVVEFDKTKTEQDLAQFRSALKSAEAGIEPGPCSGATGGRRRHDHGIESALRRGDGQTRGQQAGNRFQDRRRRSEAEAGGRRAERCAKRKQKQKSDQALNQATIESTEQASKKAKFDVQRAEQSLTQMAVRAPSAGTISLLHHWTGSRMRRPTVRAIERGRERRLRICRTPQPCAFPRASMKPNAGDLLPNSR